MSSTRCAACGMPPIDPHYRSGRCVCGSTDWIVSRDALTTAFERTIRESVRVNAERESRKDAA